VKLFFFYLNTLRWLSTGDSQPRRRLSCGFLQLKEPVGKLKLVARPELLPDQIRPAPLADKPESVSEVAPPKIFRKQYSRRKKEEERQEQKL
jgi:hypothetical protein